MIEPIFERGFLYDSYACRKGKGTHAAVERASAYARRFRYVLKCDVAKFFSSLDHDLLFGLVARRIRDEGVLWLVRTIIDGSNPQEPILRYFPGDDLLTPHERRRGETRFAAARPRSVGTGDGSLRSVTGHPAPCPIDRLRPSRPVRRR